MLKKCMFMSNVEKSGKVNDCMKKSMLTVMVWL